MENGSPRHGRRRPWGARVAVTALAGWVGLLLASCSRHGETPNAAGDREQSARSEPTTKQSDSHDGSGTADAETFEDPFARLTPETKLTVGGKRVVSGTHGMVTSVEDQATLAGVRILELGGNAVDAAVAVGFALAVTHPSAGNLGGGGFMLVHLDGPTEAIDFRETAPRALTRAQFDAMIRRKARDGAAVGVPGSVAGLYLAHQRHGVLPWSAVVEPALRLARDGHLVSPRNAKTLRWSWPHLRTDERVRAIYQDPRTGAPVSAGHRLKLPGLAVALERIAREGERGFYSGPTAEDLVASLGPHGVMTLEDLANYRAKVREPLRFPYRGWLVETMPPPSAGGVALVQTLLMLREQEVWRAPQGSAEALHLIAESARRAHAERRFHVLDPDALTQEQYLQKQSRWLDPSTWLSLHPIDRRQASASRDLHTLYDAATRELEHTTHFSVADASGGVVSCTMTLSASFGSKVFTRETGIFLNNSVASFASVGENVVRGGQRTTSSMAPTLVLASGRPALVLGSPGGDTIPNTVAQVFLNLVDYGLPLDEAIERPRIHHGFVPDEIGFERDRPLPEDVQRKLRARGHRLAPSRSVIGDANNLLLWGGEVYGYSDPREGGLAAAAHPVPQRSAAK